MKRSLCLIIGLAIVFALTAWTSPRVADFQGHWESSTEGSAFTLTLTQASKKLTGAHCSVQQKGNRIDCGLDDSEVSISGTVSDPTTVTVSFKSFYGRSSGKATIKKLNATTIEWTIIQKPQGQFHIPMHAVLTKQ